MQLHVRQNFESESNPIMVTTNEHKQHKIRNPKNN